MGEKEREREMSSYSRFLWRRSGISHSLRVLVVVISLVLRCLSTQRSVGLDKLQDASISIAEQAGLFLIPAMLVWSLINLSETRPIFLCIFRAHASPLYSARVTGRTPGFGFSEGKVTQTMCHSRQTHQPNPFSE